MRPDEGQLANGLTCAKRFVQGEFFVGEHVLDIQDHLAAGDVRAFEFRLALDERVDRIGDGRLRAAHLRARHQILDDCMARRTRIEG